jgi:hypothetical protein
MYSTAGPSEIEIQVIEWAGFSRDHPPTRQEDGCGCWTAFPRDSYQSWTDGGAVADLTVMRRNSIPGKDSKRSLGFPKSGQRDAGANRQYYQNLCARGERAICPPEKGLMSMQRPGVKKADWVEVLRRSCRRL